MPRDRSNSRRILIRQFLAERDISSQAELAEFLSAAGHQVTQSTISRDLAELGVIKTGEGTNHERYLLAEQHLAEGKRDRAHVAFRQILQRAPQDSEVFRAAREQLAPDKS